MTLKTERPSAAVRIRALKRDAYRCTYCGASGNDSELEVDHIVPIVKGGSNHLSNLTTACRDCNQQKGSKSAGEFKPTTGHGMRLVGLFYIGKKDGVIHRIGIIAGVQGETVLIETYTFLGFSSFIECIPMSRIYTDEVILTNDEEHWGKTIQRLTNEKERRDSAKATKVTPQGGDEPGLCPDDIPEEVKIIHRGGSAYKNKADGRVYQVFGHGTDAVHLRSIDEQGVAMDRYVTREALVAEWQMLLIPTTGWMYLKEGPVTPPLPKDAGHAPVEEEREGNE